MSEQAIGPKHELCIVTNDNWVISLIADREMTLGDAVLSSVIVQPKEDFDRGYGDRPFITIRKVYRLNRQGVVNYTEE